MMCAGSSSLTFHRCSLQHALVDYVGICEGSGIYARRCALCITGRNVRSSFPALGTAFGVSENKDTGRQLRCYYRINRSFDVPRKSLSEHFKWFSLWGKIGRSRRCERLFYLLTVKVFLAIVIFLYVITYCKA